MIGMSEKDDPTGGFSRRELYLLAISTEICRFLKKNKIMTDEQYTEILHTASFISMEKDSEKYKGFDV